LSEKLFNIKENVSQNCSPMMAFLPSDDIWEKFDLAGTCAVGNDDDLDLESIMMDAELEDFAKDFGIVGDAHVLDDHLAIKEEPADFLAKEMDDSIFIKEEVFQMNDEASTCDFLNDFNLPSMDLSFLEPDTLKSDCMWSSTLTHMDISQQQQNKGRKRDFSITLSECNEGIMTIKDIDLLGTTPPTFMGGNLLAGSSLNAYIETPLTSSASESDTESTSTDEEIDVVSSDDNDIYRRYLVQQQQPHHHHHHHRSQTGNNRKVPHIEAGRSLLLSRNRSPKPVQQHNNVPAPNANYCQQTFIDHSYFLVRPPTPQQSPDMIQGMLTPTESSDDDESINTQFISSTGNIDKRKIVQAVQSLIKNNKQSLLNCAEKRTSTPENIKFKFRMKFKSSGGQQHSLLAVNNRRHVRRKSASNNSHCPPPPASASKLAQPVSVLNSSHRVAASTPASPSKSSLRNSAKMSRSSGSSSSRSSPSNQEQKCREIRDLHNSMERQRRVDLRKNFDQLKSVVPELADTEKASKLNILNKASDYCKLLSGLDGKLRKDVDKETARNALLRKKLSALQAQFNSGVRVNSSRVSLVHSRR
jgi:hypothetical protein